MIFQKEETFSNITIVTQEPWEISYPSCFGVVVGLSSHHDSACTTGAVAQFSSLQKLSKTDLSTTLVALQRVYGPRFQYETNQTK